MLIRVNLYTCWWGLETIFLLVTNIGFGLHAAGIHCNHFGKIIHQCFIYGATNVLLDHYTTLRNTFIIFYMFIIGEWNVISSCFVLLWRSRNNMGCNLFWLYLFTTDMPDILIYNTHLYLSNVVPHIHILIGKVVDNRLAEVQERNLHLWLIKLMVIWQWSYLQHSSASHLTLPVTSHE